MKTKKFAYWKLLGSQAVQEIAERVEKAYQRFFAGLGGLPRFKKVKKFKSFTLKQTRTGQLQVGKQRYKFVKHRDLTGIIKTVTIKRDSCGQLWVCFSVVDDIKLPEEVSTGQIGGFDFGLRTFLTDHTNTSYDAPQYLKLTLERVRLLSKAISRKMTGSHNQKKARWFLNRTHIRIADKRRDFHYKLAHQLCDTYDVLVFEDLNLDGMKRLWGRKVSDLGFAQFVDLLAWVAFKMSRHRDHNAAINIQQAGASAYTKRGLRKTS